MWLRIKVSSMLSMCSNNDPTHLLYTYHISHLYTWIFVFCFACFQIILIYFCLCRCGSLTTYSLHVAKDIFECGLNIKFYTYLSTLIFSLSLVCLCLFGCRYICMMHVFKCVCTLETEFSLGVVAVNTDQNQPGR